MKNLISLLLGGSTPSGSATNDSALPSLDIEGAASEKGGEKKAVHPLLARVRAKLPPDCPFKAIGVARVGAIREFNVEAKIKPGEMIGGRKIHEVSGIGNFDPDSDPAEQAASKHDAARRAMRFLTVDGEVTLGEMEDARASAQANPGPAIDRDPLEPQGPWNAFGGPDPFGDFDPVAPGTVRAAPKHSVGVDRHPYQPYRGPFGDFEPVVEHDVPERETIIWEVVNAVDSETILDIVYSLDPETFETAAAHFHHLLALGEKGPFGFDGEHESRKAFCFREPGHQGMWTPMANLDNGRLHVGSTLAVGPFQITWNPGDRFSAC